MEIVQALLAPRAATNVALIVFTRLVIRRVPFPGAQ
jgi:hypothetical protein